ncbi:MAG: Eco57I restriction-modification methylase domain-containing protein, partial [Flavobacteriales bacterium]
TRYELKRHSILNSLYGVDIDPSSVEIAKLRLWLSLVVDEQDYENIKPLPNLEYRIMQGDSLIEEYEGIELFDPELVREQSKVEQRKERLKQEQLEKQREYIKLDQKDDLSPEEEKKKEDVDDRLDEIYKALEDIKDERDEETEDLFSGLSEARKKAEELEHLQNEFVNAVRKREKNELREEIEELQWELIEATLKENDEEEKLDDLEEIKQSRRRPFFLWELYFTEVFMENDGFDVVIGNPPYLESRNSKFSSEYKDKLQDAVENRWGADSKLIQRGADLLVYFFELGLHLISDEGLCVYITQNAWLDTEYGKKVQELIRENTDILGIYDSDYKYFDSSKGPNINTVITFFQGKQTTNNETLIARFKEDFMDIKGTIKDQNGVNLDIFNQQEKFIKNYKWGILLNAESEFFSVLEYLHDEAQFIEELNGNLKIGQGLNLTKNHEVKKNKMSNLGIPKEALIPFMTNDDGAPFYLSKTKKFLVNQNNLSNGDIEKLEEENIKSFDKNSTTKNKPLLILPRGLGRYFCALNNASAYSASYVVISDKSSTLDINSEEIFNLWILLNSSVGWLLRETSGRKNLGGGMLKAEAVDLSYYPLYLNIMDKVDQNLINKFKKR